MRAEEFIDRGTLLEMPFLLSGSMDWGLQYEKTNRRRVTKFLAGSPVLVRKYSTGDLMYRDTVSGGGEYCYISSGTGLAEYYMLYVTLNIPSLGKAATQVKVWNGSGPSGITQFVFFDCMLGTKFESMVSDDEQTNDGRRFWIMQLKSALNRGFNIGLYSNNTLNLFDASKENFDNWINRLDAWGRQSHHYDKRFVISNL